MKKKIVEINIPAYVEFYGEKHISCEPTTEEIRLAVQNADFEEKRSFQGDIDELKSEWNKGVKSIDEYCARRREFHARRIAYFVKTNGWREPILLCVDGKTILDGSHRLKAAKYVGCEQVNVIVTSASTSFSDKEKNKLWLVMAREKNIKKALSEVGVQILQNELVTEIISIDDGLELRPPSESDVSAIVKALQEHQIYERTIMIPFPYSEKDGKEFVEICSQRCAEYGHPIDWGIYRRGAGLIGMIGFNEAPSASVDAEGVGYWLAKPYWNQGIMTRALKKVTELGFKEYGFKRLEMPIFSFNVASCRVAEKCGYRHEKDLPDAYKKDGKTIDAKLYVACEKDGI